MFGFVQMPAVNGSGLTAVLMECDLSVEGQWNMWDESLEQGEYIEGPIIPVEKRRLVVGPTDRGFVSARIASTWKRLYFGWGDEKKEWYYPSWAVAPPPVTDDGTGYEDPVDPEDPPVDPEVPAGEGEMPPKSEDTDWDEESGEPPAPDSPPDPPTDPGEADPETPDDCDPPEKTLRLKHWVESTEMGSDIVWSFCDQGSVHVCTGKDMADGTGKLFVVVFNDNWRVDEYGVKAPGADYPTPGYYRVKLPLSLSKLDFAWDAYRQKVVFVQRTGDQWDKTENDPSDRMMRCLVGEFTPPSQASMSHFGSMDGYRYGIGGFGGEPDVVWDTVKSHWPALWEYAPIDPADDGCSIREIVPLVRPRYWSYVKGGYWRHWDRQVFRVDKSIW